MKIKTLIKKLEKLNPEFEVVLASDEEGNFFEILKEIYYNEREYYYPGHRLFYDEQDIKENKMNKKILKRAIILFP